MLCPLVSRDYSLVVPNVHTGQKLYVPVMIEQSQTEILFFRTIEPGTGRIETRFAKGRDSQYVPTADEHGGGMRLTSEGAMRTIRTQNIECDRRHSWSRFQIFDRHRDLVVTHEPSVIIEAQIIIRTCSTHELIAGFEISLLGFAAIPPNARE